jgi:hypothetical protein
LKTGLLDDPLQLRVKFKARFDVAVFERRQAPGVCPQDADALMAQMSRAWLKCWKRNPPRSKARSNFDRRFKSAFEQTPRAFRLKYANGENR